MRKGKQMTTAAAAINEKIGEFLPARVTAPGKMPWIPLSPTKSFQPLRFFSDKRGFVELLRIEPGEEIMLHRHTGEVHAFNLQGSRLLGSGELIGPGEYV